MVFCLYSVEWYNPLQWMPACKVSNYMVSLFAFNIQLKLEKKIKTDRTILLDVVSFRNRAVKKQRRFLGMGP